MPESATPQPPTALPADAELRALLSGLIDQLMANVHLAKEAYEKQQTVFISFMDRLVILAGGTLTLVFTVISSVGPRLSASHVTIRHPALIIASCWALLACILTALVSYSLTMTSQAPTSIHLNMKIAEMHQRLTLKANIPALDPSHMPLLTENLTIKPVSRAEEHTARSFGIAAQLAIITAFVMLAWFLQTNLSLLLAVR